MKISSKSKLELSDILISELFILNNMIPLEGIDVKVYLYLLYAFKHGLDLDNETIAKKICLSKEQLSNSLDRLQNEELILKTSIGYNIIDLKQREIDKLYNPKLVRSRKKQDVEKEKTRTMAASSISEGVFNGLMSFSWYTDIGIMFDRYKFDEDVMIALFNYCDKRNALNKKYVYAVAETWFKGSVKTFEELEEFLDNQTKLQTVMKKISKILRLNRNLSKYEENYIDKWINEYNFDFKVIEKALEKTISTSNPTISYVNGILKNWYKDGIKKVEDVDKVVKENKSKKVKTTNSKSTFKNYEQRKYENLDKFYSE